MQQGTDRQTDKHTGGRDHYTFCLDYGYASCEMLVHGQVTIIFVVSVGLSVCLFACAEFFSAVFDPISIKLGHMLYVWV